MSTSKPRKGNQVTNGSTAANRTGYCIAEFSMENNATYVVPFSWMKVTEGQEFCLWPPYNNAEIKAAIKRGDAPETNWIEKIAVKLYPLKKDSESFEKCQLKHDKLYRDGSDGLESSEGPILLDSSHTQPQPEPTLTFKLPTGFKATNGTVVQPPSRKRSRALSPVGENQSSGFDDGSSTDDAVRCERSPLSLHNKAAPTTTVASVVASGKGPSPTLKASLANLNSRYTFTGRHVESSRGMTSVASTSNSNPNQQPNEISQLKSNCQPAKISTSDMSPEFRGETQGPSDDAIGRVDPSLFRGTIEESSSDSSGPDDQEKKISDDLTDSEDNTAVGVLREKMPCPKANNVGSISVISYTILARKLYKIEKRQKEEFLKIHKSLDNIKNLITGKKVETLETVIPTTKLPAKDPDALKLVETFLNAAEENYQELVTFFATQVTSGVKAVERAKSIMGGMMSPYCAAHFVWDGKHSNALESKKKLALKETFPKLEKCMTEILQRAVTDSVPKKELKFQAGRYLTTAAKKCKEDEEIRQPWVFNAV